MLYRIQLSDHTINGILCYGSMEVNEWHILTILLIAIRCNLPGHIDNHFAAAIALLTASQLFALA